VQQVTGTTATQAGKLTRLGESLLITGTTSPPRDDAVVPVDAAGDAGAADDLGSASSVMASDEGVVRPWFAVLDDAYLAGRVSVEQQAAIRRGLGEPPTAPDSPELDGAAPDGTVPDGTVPDGAAADGTVPGGLGPGGVGVVGWERETCQAWAAAAEQLVEEAGRVSLEALGRSARNIRDILDPEGAERRFQQRHQNRAFRVWKDTDGVTNARIVCDDAGAAWLTAIFDTALRPRRGGPRFVDPAEKNTAKTLLEDPRSNDQLAYDLLLDVLHTGALTDNKTVFGTRQAGIRVIVTDQAHTNTTNGRAAVAIIEETNTTVPAAFATQHACDTSMIDCHLDTNGNPLYLGREARLFTAKQRLTLSIRDGGCGWPQCDRPAAYCEAHHIDPYAKGGKTDIDRGILLCRFHHMNLHHHGWRITRNKQGTFLLHPPDGGTPITLQPPLERRYAWGNLHPPTPFQPPATAPPLRGAA